jgi:hypothetical protein
LVKEALKAEKLKELFFIFVKIHAATTLTATHIGKWI